MRRSFKYLLRPTSKQADALVAMLNDHRALYNAALQERRDAYRMRGVSVRYGMQSSQLKEIRRDDPGGQGRWSFSSQQATLRRLNRAFDAFFRRVRQGGAPGFPRFKGAGWFDTVEWPVDRDGCRWDSVAGEHRVYLQGVGHVRVHRHRPIQGRVKTLSVKREARRWYVVASCDDVPEQTLDRTGAVTGIDLGVKSLLTTSEGVHVGNPEHGRANAARLATAQQALARCKRRSNRRWKARARVAALHGKVRRQRLDYLHKVALDLVRRHDVICHEDLRVGNMTRSAKGTLDEPGTNVAAKSGLNRSILDAGWSTFLTILTAKAESAGRELIGVNPANTSRTCPSCGHCARDNRVTQAEFRCMRCGLVGHADEVGALNVLRAGLARRDAATAA